MEFAIAAAVIFTGFFLLGVLSDVVVPAFTEKLIPAYDKWITRKLQEKRNMS